MCEDGKTYYVPYKDIKVPITLKLFCKTQYNAKEYKMYIGQRYIGGRYHHFDCPAQSSYWANIYGSCAEYIGVRVDKKITRAINIIEEGTSKLRGRDLKMFFRKHYGVSCK